MLTSLTVPVVDLVEERRIGDRVAAPRWCARPSNMVTNSASASRMPTQISRLFIQGLPRRRCRGRLLLVVVVHRCRYLSSPQDRRAQVNGNGTDADLADQCDRRGGAGAETPAVAARPTPCTPACVARLPASSASSSASILVERSISRRGASPRGARPCRSRGATRRRRSSRGRPATSSRTSSASTGWRARPEPFADRVAASASASASAAAARASCGGIEPGRSRRAAGGSGCGRSADRRVVGSSTNGDPAAATIARSSARRQPSSGRISDVAPSTSVARRGSPASPATPDAARGAHQEGLGLIVGMVRGERAPRRRPPAPMLGEQRVARVARAAPGCCAPAIGAAGVSVACGTPSARAMLGDHRRLLRRLGAQAVIDRGARATSPGKAACASASIAMLSGPPDTATRAGSPRADRRAERRRSRSRAEALRPSPASSVTGSLALGGGAALGDIGLHRRARSSSP